MPVDIGSIKRNDQIAGAAAVLAFIFALIPGARTGEVKEAFQGQAGVSDSESSNLWHGLGVLAALLLLIAIAGLVAAILQVSELQALPVRWISTAAFGLATLFALIYCFTYDGVYGEVPSGVDAGEFIDFGVGIVGWLLLLALVVGTVFTALGAVESGEQLPGRGPSTAGPEATPPPAA